jgi:chemotaxis protein histidine kinase CheA
LSLTFGGQGPGLPGFGLPWQERRIEAPALRVVLMPAQIPAAEPAATSVSKSLPQASIDQPVAGGPALTAFLPDAPILGRPAESIAPEGKPTAQAQPEPGAATGVAPAKAPLHTEGSGDAAPTPIPESAVIAMERSDDAKWVAPAVPVLPAPVVAPASSASSPEALRLASRGAGDAAQERIDAGVRERAVELARLERSEREAQRQAVQREAARIEAERQAAALQEAARQEAQRVETARLEAIRQEAQRAENARSEAERQEAARQQAARQAAVRQEAARVEAAQEEAAGREAARRAMGRQLDEEAARREAASTATSLPSTLAPSPSSARRGRLFGRSDPNAELMLYAEAWVRKIQLNMTFDMVRDAAKRPHAHPLVTVAIRRTDPWNP